MKFVKTILALVIAVSGLVGLNAANRPSTPTEQTGGERTHTFNGQALTSGSFQAVRQAKKSRRAQDQERRAQRDARRDQQFQN